MVAPVVQGYVTNARGSFNPGSIDVDVSTLTINAGDLLLVNVYLNSQYREPFIPPKGWVVLRHHALGSTDPYSCTYFCYKIATASEPTIYTFDYNERTYVHASLIQVRGADTADPIDVSTGIEISAQYQNTPNVTTSVNDALILRYASTNESGSYATPTGNTVVLLENDNFGEHIVTSEVQATAGTTSTETFEYLNKTTFVILQTLAIRPAGTSSPSTTAAMPYVVTAYELYAGQYQTATVDLPSEAQPGDVMVVGSARTYHGAFRKSDWTILGYENDVGSYGYSFVYRVIDGTEKERWDYYSSNLKAGIAVYLIRGCDINNPINVYATEELAQTKSGTSPAVTTTRDNCLLLSGLTAATDYFNATTWTGATDHVASPDARSVSIASYGQATAGVSTPPTWSTSHTPDDTVHQHTVALQPPADNGSAPTIDSRTLSIAGPFRVDFGFDTNEPGTVDLIATTDTGTPSVAQIQAGQDATGSFAEAHLAGGATLYGYTRFALNGLQENTTFRFWSVLTDQFGNDTGVVDFGSATTPVSSRSVPTVRDVSSAYANANASATVPMPALAQLGDVLVAFFADATDAPILSDWTQVARPDTSYPDISVWWKRYDGAETGIDVDHHGGGVILALTGCDIINPISTQTQIYYQDDSASGDGFFRPMTASLDGMLALHVIGRFARGYTPTLDTNATELGSFASIRQVGHVFSDAVGVGETPEVEWTGNAALTRYMSLLVTPAPADAVLPTLSSLGVSEPFVGNVTLSANVSEASGYAYGVLATPGSGVTAQQVVAGLDSTNVTAPSASYTFMGGESTVSLSMVGLINTTYAVFAVQIDAAGNVSQVYESASITTSDEQAVTTFSDFPAADWTAQQGTNSGTIEDGGTGTVPLDDSLPVTFAFYSVSVPAAPQGILIESGAQGDGMALAFDGAGTLVGMAGQGNVSTAGTAAVRVEVDSRPFHGTNVDIFWCLRASAPGRGKIYVYESGTGKLVGFGYGETTDGSIMGTQDPEGDWTGLNTLGVGTAGDNDPTSVRAGVNTSDFNGTMSVGVSAWADLLPADFDTNIPLDGSMVVATGGFVSLAGTQDANGGIEVLADGVELQQTGNSWKAYPLSYTVTQNTIMEFWARVPAVGELQGIGVSMDLDWSPTDTDQIFFWIAGTDVAMMNDSNSNGDYLGQADAAVWQHYQIPLGTYWTGDPAYFVFMNDDDADSSGVIDYRWIKLYESGAFTDDFSRTSLGTNWAEVHFDGTGSVTLDGSTVTVDTGGTGDFWTEVDTASMIYRPVSITGSWRIEVTATTWANGNDFNRLLMARSSADANARMFAITRDGVANTQLGLVTRDGVGVSAAWSNGLVTVDTTSPIHLRIDHDGTTTTAYYSQDGKTTWTEIGSRNVGTLSLACLAAGDTSVSTYDDYSEQVAETTPTTTVVGKELDLIWQVKETVGRDLDLRWDVVQLTHDLAADDLVSAAILTSAGIGQTQTLGADALAASAGLTQAALSQIQSLSADDLASASTVSEVPVDSAAQLDADSLITGSALQTVGLGQTHVVQVDQASAGSTTSAVALSQTQTLTSDDVAAAGTLTGIALAQTHALLADSLASTATLPGVEVLAEGAISVESVVSASSLTQPAIAQTQTLLADDLAGLGALAPAVLSQTHTATVDSISATGTVTTGTLTQTHITAVESVTASGALTLAQIAQTHLLTAENVSASTQADTVTLTQSHQIASAAVAAASSLSSPAVTQIQSLTADPVSAGASLPGIEVSSDFKAIGAALFSTSSLDAVALSQTQTLGAQSVTAAAGITTASLTQEQTLAGDPLAAPAALTSGATQQTQMLDADQSASSASASQVAVGQTQQLSVSSLAADAMLATVGITQNQMIGAENLASAKQLRGSTVYEIGFADVENPGAVSVSIAYNAVSATRLRSATSRTPARSAASLTRSRGG